MVAAAWVEESDDVPGCFGRRWGNLSRKVTLRFFLGWQDLTQGTCGAKATIGSGFKARISASLQYPGDDGVNGVVVSELEDSITWNRVCSKSSSFAILPLASNRRLAVCSGQGQRHPDRSVLYTLSALL